jgi:hypothetical protein
VFILVKALPRGDCRFFFGRESGADHTITPSTIRPRTRASEICSVGGASIRTISKSLRTYFSSSAICMP